MHIEDYSIQLTLQQGRRFTIYRALKEKNTMPCILKVLDKKGVRDASTILELKHEYSFLQEIDSEYVIKAIDWIDHKDYTVLVLEDINGNSIKDEIEKRRFSIEQFIVLSQKITKGLAAIHKQNIIHKNINPTNIIWNSRTCRLKIIDFSIASKFDVKVSYAGNPEKLQGTLPYLSPEQSGRINHKVDKRSDLYSLGVTFYEMLTGKLPFEHQDPMKIVYAHLTHNPKPPHLINENIPEMLSKVVLKLLAKNSQERYQSIEGLKQDLQKLQEGNLSDFKLGKKDFSGTLQIPKKLYGREKEIEQLISTYQKVSKGAKEMIMLVGYSGTGKTALVNEIRKTIARDRGYLIGGKFEQLHRNIPYFAFIQAIQEFCDLLLTENDSILANWKQTILKAVGNLGKVLTDIIPKLEHVIGKQTSVPHIDGTEAKIRFNYVFSQFMQAISTKKHPLVIFIDDLQWADFGSLELLKLLMTETQNRFFLFIGAYRDNEISPGHFLTVTIEELRKQKVPIHTIPVKNMTQNNIEEWLIDMLRCANPIYSKHIKKLSNIIYHKTHGNAFFTIQFIENLYREGILTFDSSRLTWKWDIKKIEQLDITDNVVDLLSRTIKSLPTDVQDVLKLSSCVGNIFDAGTLSFIARKDIKIQESMEIAIRENLIHPLDDHLFKFMHDRIQHAAYNLISERDKKPVHLKIGRLLLKKFHILDDTETFELPGKTDQHIFDIVNHLNIGIDLINDENEKIIVLRLNLKAAQKSKAATAYQTGWEYIQRALAVIHKYSWKKYYDLTLSVYNEAIEMAFLTSNYTEMEYLGDIVLKYAEKIMDKSTVYGYKIVGLITENKFEKALKVALEVLRSLGVNVPAKQSERDMKIFSETKSLLDEKGPEGLKNLQPMEEEDKKLALSIYLRASGALSLADQELYSFMINIMLQISLKYGEAPETPFLFTEYALLNAFKGNIPEATKYSKLSIELSSKQKNCESMRVRMLTHNYTYVLHWSVSYKKLPDIYWNIYKLAIQVGDLLYAAWELINYFIFYRYIDEELTIVEQKGKKILELIRQLKQPLPARFAEIWLQVIQCLANTSQESLPISVDLEALLPTITDDVKHIEQFYIAVSKIFLNCIFEKEELFDCSEILQNSPILVGIYEYPNYIVYSSVLKLHVIKKMVPSTEKVKLLKEVRKNKKKIKEWADFGPDNFLHRYYLIEAELAGIEGRIYEAREYYDKAIETANKNEFLCDEAMSNELAAKFYIKNNREGLAVFYFQRAYQCYRKWGAIAKVNQLDENYPKYVSAGIPASKLGTGTISSTATDTTAELLDVRSIIKASQTLSGEVQLENLLEKMMKLLIENAGAQKGFFIEYTGECLLLQAQGTKARVSGILEALPVEESRELPLSVINYVARTKQKLVYDNVSKGPDYSTDIYIQKHQPKSVVCFPIVRKDELSAIIYLENNLVEGAFTPARVEILNTLSSQIAISIENARIYRDLDELNKSLEQKVRERTRQLEEMDKAKSRFFANISHEFRTPLTLIMGPLEKRLSMCRDNQDIQEMQMMLRNSRRLLNLVNQLLELARLESGKMKLEASQQNVVPFVKNIVMCFESMAAQNEVSLIFHKEEDEIPLFFDPEKLEKIITNLLSNAFKYTPAGGKITVSVRKLAGNDRLSSGCVEISIKDTGTGIPRDQLPHIFDRFYRGEGGHEHKGKGSGIGLALTKELVELHHGEIEAQSSCRDDNSRGSEFFIRLSMGEQHLQPEEIEDTEKPATRRVIKIFDQTFSKVWPPAGPPEASKETREIEKVKEEKPLVLVVEDNADVRTYIKSSLESYFKIIEAADGKEGILRAKEIIPDLIISDVMMPGADGFQLCRTLKQDILTSHVPIILLTARVSEESVLQGLETGADDYITKPFSTDLLAVRARNLIDLRRQLQLEQKNRLAFQPDEISVSPLDNEFYRELLDTIESNLSDPDFNVEVLSRKLQMSQATLYRKIHGLTGQTPGLFIRSYRLKRAAQLLAANAGSVSYVADRVGFPDKSYFARCFKEQFHCLPSDVQPQNTSNPIETDEPNQTLLRKIAGPGGETTSLLEKSLPGRRGQGIILIVEDSDDTRTYIRQSLEPEYHVVEAVDGNEGTARAMEIIPDLIISDIMMPGMDGYELCRLLKQDVRSCHIPIVLLTARAAEESKIKGLETGADDYITKPFNTQILRARIKNLIRLRSHLQEKRNREMTLLPVKISEPEIDRQFIKELDAVIEKNLEDSDFNVEQLGKKLYMSSATLYRKIQALSGEIPSEYIRSFRLRRAAQLLKENFGSVTEVAFEVGFNSRTYFTKCFKEKFHQLPSVYMAAESQS